MTRPARRGEIWWTAFPADHPDKGRRPVIVVSTDARNAHPRANTVLVIPLSPSIHSPGPSHLLLRAGETGLREDSIACAENIAVVGKDQIGEPVQGHRALSHTQICKLAGLVKVAMACVD
jgi:mRNA-degrading endonuclease toxin of MazEF toxin-antitoxin module